MARATLTITPDVLSYFPAILPLGVNVFGTAESGGVLSLVLEGASLPDGGQLQLVVHNDALSRRFELQEVVDG